MKVLLTVFLGVLISQAKAYAPDQTCAIVQTNTFIADPTDCSGYYYCVNGEIYSQGKCGNGLRYNSFTGTCDYADKVTCNFGTSLCQGVAFPTYKADPTSCSGYIWCDGKNNALYNTCPNGQHFDLETTSCIWSGPNTCAGTACELVPNQKFVATSQTLPDGTTQTGAYTCFNGHAATTTWCPSGTTYDSIYGECVPSPDVDENPTAICSTASTATKNFAASPSNCNQYYWCPPPPSTAQPVKLNCPKRFHFNTVTNTCVYSWLYKPVGGNANCDRCGGYATNQYVSDSTCTKYLFCMNGDGNDGATNKNEPALACSNKNYPHFNEQTQSCVGDKPNTGVCAPAT